MSIKPIIGGSLLTVALIAGVASSINKEPVAPTSSKVMEACVIEPTRVPTTSEPKSGIQLDQAEVELIARTIWGEAGGVKSMDERAAVAWCILNRVDAYEQSIVEVVTAPNQFKGYRSKGDCPEEHMVLAADVLTRWYQEKAGAQDVGRTLPVEYLYFIGDGSRNHFSEEYLSGEYWGWTLKSPYATE